MNHIEDFRQTLPEIMTESLTSAQQHSELARRASADAVRNPGNREVHGEAFRKHAEAAASHAEAAKHSVSGFHHAYHTAEAEHHAKLADLHQKHT